MTRVVAWCERCKRVLYTLTEAGHYGRQRCCPNPRCSGSLRYVGVDYDALAGEQDHA